MKQEMKINTEYNSNLYRTLSLNQLLDQAIDYSRVAETEGKISWLKMWRSTLIGIYDEIEPKMITGEKRKAVKMFAYLKEIGKVVSLKNTPDGTVNIIDKRKYSMHWSQLNKIGRFLRHTADSKGMLLTNKTHDEEIGEMS